MRLLNPICCLGIALLLSSCIGMTLPGPLAGRTPLGLRVPVQPPLGGIYTNVKAPLMVDLDKSPTSSPKVGKAKSKFIRLFWPILSVSFDDASIEAAAKNGGITKIHYADYDLMMVLGIYGEFTTTVYGE